jgi:hypothetical protein
MDDLQILDSADQVFEALGGPAGVAELTGSKSPRVSNWKASGSFPPAMYGLMIDALNARGKTAPRALWRMKQRADATGEHA